MQPVAKGVIQVAGVTSRIVRAMDGQGVIPVLDHVCVGTVSQRDRIEAGTNGADDRLVREIVRTAIPRAKTGWVGRLALG